jgi:hypothetical protein
MKPALPLMSLYRSPAFGRHLEERSDEVPLFDFNRLTKLAVRLALTRTNFSAPQKVQVVLALSRNRSFVQLSGDFHRVSVIRGQFK